MEEALKCLKIVPKILCKRSNAMWDILLASEEETKQLSGSILRTKTLRLQTEYMGTRRTRVTLHGVSMDIKEDHVGDFFALYGQVEEVARILSKTDVPTGDFQSK